MAIWLSLITLGCLAVAMVGLWATAAALWERHEQARWAGREE